MQVRAVFFDVGYTVFDEVRIWREWADWLGVEPARLFEALRLTIERDHPHQSVFSTLSPGFDLESARQARWRAGQSDGFRPSDLYPDVWPCVLMLKAGRLTLGVAGNTTAATEAVLRDTGLPFDIIGSSAGWSVSKPAPAFFEHMAQATRLPPAAIAYVGDRLDNDVLPAVRAGLWAVFLQRGPWADVQRSRPERAEAAAVIDSLAELPRRSAWLGAHPYDRAVNLVLLGPPGSGKGTQASRLSDAYRAPAIATGDILRAQREAGTRLGLQARRYLDSGELVPDRLVIEIIRHRLHEPDTEHGFILDGFPRTVAQGEALDELLAELHRPIDLVLYLQIGRDALMNRLGHRYICPSCGAVYSLSGAQLQVAKTCSRDGATLDQRSDDRPDIVAHRIDVFLHQTAPLIDHYRGQRKLVLVEADQSADKVYGAMTRVLDSRSSVNSTA